MATKIACPPPPPTSNTLTNEQRSQLLRSAKKLGRVLGSTPHLIDEIPRSVVPVHINLSFKFPAKPAGQNVFPAVVAVHDGGHSPSDSISSTSSSDSSLDFGLDTSSVSSIESTSSSHIEHVNVTKFRRPFLRLHPKPKTLASSRPTLETIPGSPSPYSLTHDTASCPPVHRVSPPNTPPAAVASSFSPAFTISSDASLRRAKMERLRRRLGDGVPIEMVFSSNNDKSERSPGSDSDQEIVALTRQPTPPESVRLDDSHRTLVSRCPSSYRSSFRKSLGGISETEEHVNDQLESGWYDSDNAAEVKDRRLGHRRARVKELFV